MTDRDLADLEAALPLMTPAEQAEALALLEEDRKSRFLTEMPDAILNALCNVSEAVQLARGAGRIAIAPHPCDVYAILGDDNQPLPYADWRRRDGQPLTPLERSSIGPLVASSRSNPDVDPWADEVTSLLPPTMRERVRQALQRGAW